MGNDQEFNSMVKFVNRHKMVPVIDSVFTLEDGHHAFPRMEKEMQFGKIVLEI